MNAFVLVIAGILAFIVFSALVRSVRIVPSRAALVVERLGKYSRTLEAGFHILVPFIERVRHRHNLKEQAIDVPSQPCVTLDNVKVDVDGVLYFYVVDPRKASYGIRDYRYATIQLAQTNMRSVIGKLELDRTFEEREQINGTIVRNVDEASDPWGVKVTRYEIQNIKVPDSVLESMEYQMRAEREKRAAVARSIGDMESRINRSVGIMEEAINKSEGEKQRRINEAEGRASEIKALAHATGASIAKLAEAIDTEGGEEAIVLRLAESYINELDKLARNTTELILPMDLTDISGIVARIRESLVVTEGIGDNGATPGDGAGR